MVKISLNIVTPLKEWFFEKSNLITSWSSTASDTKVASEKLVKDELDKKAVKTDVDTALSKKVDKTSIKTTISNSLTNDDVVGGKALYDKISAVEAGIPDGMVHTDITDWDTATADFEETTNRTTTISSSASDSKYPTEKAVKDALDDAKTTADTTYAKKSHNHTSSEITDWSNATSGFEQNSNKATNLTSPNDTKYPTTKAVSDGLATAKTNADNTYATKTALTNGLNEKINTSAKTTSLSNTSSDNQVPSAKAVYDLYESIPKWQVKPIESIDKLPDTGLPGTIYVVPVEGGSGNNKYIEFLWNDSADEPGYEQFGGIELDISKLITKKQMTDYLANNTTLTLDSTGELAINIIDATE